MSDEIVKAVIVTGDPIFLEVQRYLAENGYHIPPDAIRACEWCREMAHKGDSSAQLALSEMLCLGMCQEEKSGEAFLWCKASADQNNPGALLLLSRLMEAGDERHEPSMQEAVRLLKLSAEAGYAAAMTDLAMMYLGLGDILELDRVRALELLSLASSQGDPYAKCKLGLLFLEEKEDHLAQHGVRLLTEAADMDYVPANRHLGYFYMDGGRGLGKDESKSKFYFDRAESIERQKTRWLV